LRTRPDSLSKPQAQESECCCDLGEASYRASLAQLPWFQRVALAEGRWDIRPTGGLFLRSWFDGCIVEYPRLPVDLSLCRFWDLAATKGRAGSDPDYTAGVLLGRGPDGVLYVIDVVRAQASDLEILELIAQTAQADRRLAEVKGWAAPMIRMEQEPGAASTYLIGEFRRRRLVGFDFRGVRPRGSKLDRARPLSAPADAGELRLLRAPWNGDFLDELCAFPVGRHDDQVDALSGAFEQVLANIRGRARVTKARIIG
jgi:predicted phage terminase large subunit-like protein